MAKPQKGPTHRYPPALRHHSHTEGNSKDVDIAEPVLPSELPELHTEAGAQTAKNDAANDAKGNGGCRDLHKTV